MQPLTRSARLLSLFLPFALLACGDDNPTGTGPANEGIFARYVSLGNSIAAGFQSGGINDSVQLVAYPALIAQQMGLSIGTDFVLPLLNRPGCAPPFVNIFTQERVDMGGPSDCAGRIDNAIPHNVAVPGAKVIDALSNTDSRSNANALTSLFLGTGTQLSVAQQLRPTFVTVWLGANDALGAALNGDATLLTPVDLFERDYLQLADSIEAMGVQGAVLIGVPQVLNIPNLSAGAAYWVADQMGALPPTLSVAANCAPTASGGAGETTLVPFGYGFGVLLAQASQGMAVTLDCLTDPPVVSTGEIVAIIGAVARYNTIIQREAARRGWGYLDPNPTLDSLRATGEVPLFPNSMGIDALLQPFGPHFSRDGFHPSTSTQRLIANKIIEVINATYNQSIPAVP